MCTRDIPRYFSGYPCILSHDIGSLTNSSAVSSGILSNTVVIVLSNSEQPMGSRVNDMSSERRKSMLSMCSLVLSENLSEC